MLCNTQKDIKIAWVRGHIGIEGNEKADYRATYESILGQIRGSPRTITEGGLRAASKAIRKAARTKEGFGKRRVEWSRQGLSAYTWMRCDRGPQTSWLNQVGKSITTECACGHPLENAHHIVWDCPRLHRQRSLLLGERRTWEELDKQVWIKEGEESFEATEAFFEEV